MGGIARARSKLTALECAPHHHDDVDDDDDAASLAPTEGAGGPSLLLSRSRSRRGRERGLPCFWLGGGRTPATLWRLRRRRRHLPATVNKHHRPGRTT